MEALQETIIGQSDIKPLSEIMNLTVEADLRDSVIIRDTVRVAVKTVEMNTPYLQISGMIENNRLSGNIRLPRTETGGRRNGWYAIITVKKVFSNKRIFCHELVPLVIEMREDRVS
jgi:hypothetical protein